MTTPDPITTALEALLDRLSQYRFDRLNEAKLAAQLCLALEALHVHYVQEFPLAGGRGRLDFYLPDTGLFIETKVNGSWATVLAQLQRYCEAPGTAGGLLVTGRHSLRGMPATLAAKPLRVLWVGYQL